ncbi:MAG: hypothetical protein O3B64_00060 [bacterium]|nr:hypothetical protein [bacterium]MDA1024518.1 hypothetical protein [bacterium]
MIVYSAITPHSPLLLKNVNAEKLHEAEETLQSLREIREDLALLNIDTLVLISEQPTSYEYTVSMNVQDPYRFDLSAFGDLTPKEQFHPDMTTIDAIQRSLRKSLQPITLTSDKALHFASFTPLSLLLSSETLPKLIPITHGNMPSLQQFTIGQAIGDILKQSDKRIAIIAAGDLAHEQTTTVTKSFDRQYIELVEGRHVTNFLKLETIASQSKELIYKQTVLLFGMIDGMSYLHERLCYESPFGVGFYTGRMQFTQL